MIYLAGDSTMAPKVASRRPETGWGERLQAFFDPRQVRVENRARNGRSTRTFLEEGRWGSILEDLARGDFVIIEFGHNDESRGRESFTPPEEYRRLLERFVSDVRERGATPLLFTPIARRRFDSGGRPRESHAEYSAIVRDVAARTDTVLIDLDALSLGLLASLGPERSQSLFLILEPGESPNYPDGVRDNTHLSRLGAERIAELAVGALRKERTAASALLR